MGSFFLQVVEHWYNKTLTGNISIHRNSNLKGTVSIFSSHHACKNYLQWHAEKLCLVYELDINVFNFENWSFSTTVSLKKWLIAEKYIGIEQFKSRKTTI